MMSHRVPLKLLTEEPGGKENHYAITQCMKEDYGD